MRTTQDKAGMHGCVMHILTNHMPPTASSPQHHAIHAVQFPSHTASSHSRSAIRPLTNPHPYQWCASATWSAWTPTTCGEPPWRGPVGHLPPRLTWTSAAAFLLAPRRLRTPLPARWVPGPPRLVGLCRQQALGPWRPCLVRSGLEVSLPCGWCTRQHTNAHSLRTHTHANPDF